MTMLSKREWIVLAAIVGTAMALRIPGLFNELWLDEVWSLSNALSVASPAAIFSALRTDNNHHLTSLWLYAAGPDAAPWIYRALSMACGAGTVVVAFLLGRRDSDRHAIVTASLFAISFPYVYYSSEARGYAPVVFFTLSAWFCLWGFVERRTARALAGWWICCLLGVMAHQTFVVCFLAALAWCDVHVERASRSVRAATRTTALAFAVPAVALMVFYLVSLRGTTIAGGPATPRAVVLTQALAQLSGASAAGLRSIAAIITATLFVVSIVRLRQRGDDRWILYLGGAVFGPALLLIAQPSASTYPRYFLVPTTFVLLACADTMARALLLPRWRIGVVLALSAMLWGSVAGVRELAAYGRGRFDEAVRDMAAAGAATVAWAPEYSQFDVRGRMLVDYYARRTANAARLRFVSADQYPAEGTDWIVRESIQAGAPIDREFVDRRGHRYAFVREYKAAAPAGINWRLYRKAATQ
jgi:hypothetical protein